MEDQIEKESTATVNAPSLYNLKCPNCESNDFTIIGSAGSKGTAAGVSLAFGAVGAIVANAVTKDSTTLVPITCKCKSCKKKFDSLPLVAPPEEILSSPCKITFTRKSAFTGMAVSQTVWLNGIKVGSVGNGKTIEFQTLNKHNILFVTDQFGVALPGDYRFEASPGGTVTVDFKRKFG
ncbi:MAG: hypothetical protein LIO58_01310 [Oscillospiraceae bacterium]|nr:hypothetical protein [Oscillospiraceae bacterium]